MAGLSFFRSIFRSLGAAQNAGSRAQKASPKAKRPSPRRGLQLDFLEDRITPNNRFVIPLDVPTDNVSTFHTLSQAMSTPGIISGDFVEIKQGSIPGGITDDLLPNVTNFTIRGETGVGPKDLAEITFLDSVTITPGRDGFKLQNVNLNIVGGTLAIEADASFQGNRISVNTLDSIGIDAGFGVQQLLIQNNEILNTSAEDVIHVFADTDSQNIISGNFFTSSISTHFISYEGFDTTTDIVRDNTFVANAGPTTSSMLVIGGGLDGLTIQRNSFRDSDSSAGAIEADYGVLNLKVLQNTIDLPGTVTGGAIQVDSGDDEQDTSFSIIANTIRAGNGTGINLLASETGTYTAIVQGNNFLAATIGISVGSAGVSLDDVDLGGGTQGSLGANNFRYLRSSATPTSGAIVAGIYDGQIQAKNNLFSSVGPNASVYDRSDSPPRGDLILSGNLTGNAAFVQSLYLRFLHRAANLSNPNDGGNFVTYLSQRGSVTTVINAISRSAEAFGFVVEDLYHSILNRDADAAGRAAWVSQLVNGASLEAIKGLFYSSAEYRNRFSSDRAFVVSLYSTVLGRVASNSEYQGWVAQIPSAGRAGVASAILNSAEARLKVVARLYPTLLKRAASTSELSAWVATGLGELGIQSGILNSSEGLATL